MWNIQENICNHTHTIHFSYKKTHTIDDFIQEYYHALLQIVDHLTIRLPERPRFVLINRHLKFTPITPPKPFG